jgi:hypothetical protein
VPPIRGHNTNAGVLEDRKDRLQELVRDLSGFAKSLG